jgi:hypothetical protein
MENKEHSGKMKQEKREALEIFIICLANMAVGGLGLWLTRGVVLGTVVALPTIIRYFDNILINPPSETTILGLSTLIPVLPLILLMLGVLVAVIISAYSVNLMTRGLNGIRMVNGDNEAVQGFVIKLPFSSRSIIAKKPEIPGENLTK